MAGIFDRFHDGHKEAIKEALKLGETVHILFLHTGDEFTHPDKTIELVEPFEIRIEKVKTFVKELDAEKRIKYYGEEKVVGLPPVFGFTVLRDCEELGWVQCSVDQELYQPFAETLDFIRVHAYRKPKVIFYWIPPVVDENGKKISSSKIRRAELNV